MRTRVLRSVLVHNAVHVWGPYLVFAPLASAVSAASMARKSRHTLRGDDVEMNSETEWSSGTRNELSGSELEGCAGAYLSIASGSTNCGRFQ